MNIEQMKVLKHIGRNMATHLGVWWCFKGEIEVRYNNSGHLIKIINNDHDSYHTTATIFNKKSNE